MTKRKVIAIGLDAADPDLVDSWINDGHMKCLRNFRKNAAYARIKGSSHYKAETPWTVFLTGVPPENSGYWGGIELLEGTYKIRDRQAYDYLEYPPFYASDKDCKTVIFDVPKGTLVEGLIGLQVLAWGAHSPGTPSHSMPANFMRQLNDLHGMHPALHKDHGDWWDEAYLKRLLKNLKDGIQMRVNICKEFLQKEDFNLFLTVFSETHSAGHDFWFASRSDHPLHNHPVSNVFTEDPLFSVFESVDSALGQILNEATEEDYVVIFSVHGSDNNTTDVSSMFLLGEFLYRWNFPGQYMVKGHGKVGTKPPSLITRPRRKTWSGEIWARQYDPNIMRSTLRKFLPSRFHNKLESLLGSPSKKWLSPQELQEKGDPFFWQPVSWYQNFWPQMKAFAIPSFSEGYIRINLEGREPQGLVKFEDYDKVCEDLISNLCQIVNPRNGQPVVKNVFRTRDRPEAEGKKLPSADLVVEWADCPADVIDHPSFGRIGPVPYRRTGSHRSKGFIAVQGPDITPGTTLRDCRITDLAPTILDLMGVDMPSWLVGESVLDRARTLIKLD